MNKTALIFPGQGAQKSGMGKDLFENSQAARRVFETADKVLGFSVSEMCFSGSDEELMKTVNSQPCIVTVEIAALEALREKMQIEICAAAGHSLGEYSALYAAGAADLETVLKLIRKRAELMNSAAEKTKGAMAAVIGLSDEEARNVLKDLNNVYAANYNSPGQVVITGEKYAVDSSFEKFKAAGAKKVIPLAVSGAFHSPLMREAAEEFESFAAGFRFSDAAIPVYKNTSAEAETSGAAFRKELPAQIYSPVLWAQTINNMISGGIYNYIETGPGKVLAGLNKKINSELNTINVYDLESLKSCISQLKEKELV